MSYNPNNIFAKVLRGEIPTNKKIYEDDFVLAFHNIKPNAPIHALIIPKGTYTDMDDFSKNAANDEIVGLFRGVSIVTDELGLSDNGYRMISNCKSDGCQEIPHLHLHILAGEPIGPLRAE